MYVIVPQTIKEELRLFTGKCITLKTPCCTIKTKFPAGNLVLIVQQGVFKVIHFPVNNRSSSFIVWGTITYIIHYTL